MKTQDPYTRIQRQPFATLGMTIPLLTLVVLFQVFNPRTDLFLKVMFLVPYTIFLVTGVFALLRYRLNLTRLDQRRERALHGERSLLAREQPLTDPAIFPLPTTITLEQPRRGVVLLGFMLAFVLFIPFVIGIVAGLIQNHHGSSSNALFLTVLLILGWAIVTLLVALVLIFFLLRHQLNFTIVVDERGLSSTYRGSTSSITWADARLFAVLNPEKPSVMRFYELSNEQTVVRWVNMPARAIFGRREQRLHAEYRRNVQSLLSFIRARTGLPLYDLSPSADAKAVRT